MSEVVLFCSWVGCSESLGPSMEVEGEWPRWLQIQFGGQLRVQNCQRFGVHVGLGEI